MRNWEGSEPKTPESAIATDCATGLGHFDLIGSMVGIRPYLRSTVAQL